MDSERLVDWILEQRSPFGSLYFYGSDPCRICEAARPIHISYSPHHKREIWAFADRGVPTKKGIERWINQQSYALLKSAIALVT